MKYDGKQCIDVNIKAWSNQDNFPAGNLNWSQREDNNGDCLNRRFVLKKYIFYSSTPKWFSVVAIVLAD